MMADTSHYLSISCSFSSSSRCLRSTDSMICRSSSVRWLRSGIGGSDGRRPIDAMSAERTSTDVRTSRKRSDGSQRHTGGQVDAGRPTLHGHLARADVEAIEYRRTVGERQSDDGSHNESMR